MDAAASRAGLAQLGRQELLAQRVRLVSRVLRGRQESAALRAQLDRLASQGLPDQPDPLVSLAQLARSVSVVRQGLAAQLALLDLLASAGQRGLLESAELLVQLESQEPRVQRASRARPDQQVSVEPPARPE